MIGLSARRLWAQPIISMVKGVNLRAAVPMRPAVALLQRTLHSEPEMAYHYELLENNYVYPFVHKNLESYSSLADSAPSLPIYHMIQELISEYSIVNQDYSTISAIFTSRFLDTDFPMEPQYYNEIKQAIRGMNQQELAMLLSAIQSEINPVTKVVMQLIDLELKWLLKSHANTRLMDLDLWFYIADVFYEAQMNSSFVDVLVSYLASNEIIMKNSQLLHLLFLVNLKRQRAPFLSKLTTRIRSLVDTAGPTELAIVCLAFFKTETPMDDKDLCQSVINRLRSLLPELDPKSSAFCGVIKTLRYSHPVECREDFERLIQDVYLDRDRILFASVYNLVQVLRATEAFRVHIPGMADTAFSFLMKNLNSCRIKDIYMVLRYMAQCNFKPNTEELDRLTSFLLNDKMFEVRKYPNYTFKILLSLSYLDYYPKELYKIVQESSYFLDWQRKSDLSSRTSVLILHSIIKLRAPYIEFKPRLEYLSEISQALPRPGSLGVLRLNDPFSSLKYIMSHTVKTNPRSLRLKLILDYLIGRYESQSNIQIGLQYTIAHQRYPDIIVSRGCPPPGHFDARTLLPQNVMGDHLLINILWSEDMLDNESLPRGSRLSEMKLKEQLRYKVLALPWYEVLSFDNSHVSPSIKNHIDKLLTNSNDIIGQMDPDQIEINCERGP